MQKELFQETIEKINTTTNVEELQESVKQIYTNLLQENDKDIEQRKEILKKIATIASNFGESFDIEMKDQYNITHLIGISFDKDNRPKVYTGYKWFGRKITDYNKAMEEHEYRYIKELNVDNEEITRKSYIPNLEYQNNNEETKYNDIAETLYTELKTQYTKRNNNVLKLVKK